MNKYNIVLIIMMYVVMLFSCNKTQEVVPSTDGSEQNIEISKPETDKVYIPKFSQEEIQAYIRERNVALSKEREEAFWEAYGEAGEAPVITLEELVGKWWQISRFDGGIYPEGNYFEVTMEEEYRAVLHFQGYDIFGIIQQEDKKLFFIEDLGTKYTIGTTTKVLPDELSYRGIYFNDGSYWPNPVTEMASLQREDIIKKRLGESVYIPEPSKISKEQLAMIEWSGRTMYVNSPEGLRMRDDSSIQGKINLILPNKQEVRVISIDPIDVIIDGIKGYWAFIEVDGQRGWVFSGYLRP